ncbi:hypothetical protein L6164_018449 [Bauhinia variegata]|uniref:Uncharacterized protein n=1 Tax=Bauhinia variegata TaxID=167791 RepID=A0ACB9NCZ6_BAUVA|nr:hypothetical protein L6164_018449 [Bauhinia variegata]
MMGMNSLLPIIFFLINCISLSSLPSSASELSYKDHCAAIVPESSPTDLTDDAFPLGGYHYGYYTGGKRLPGLDSSRHENSFDLKTRNVRATDVSGLFKIEASLSFRTSYPYYYEENFSNGSWSQYGPENHYHRRMTTIRLDGFWSESSGKLCMVGTGKAYSKKGNLLDLDAVFKLNNVADSSNIASLISGSLESLSSENDESYFEPISVLMLPRLNYKYTLDSVDGGDFSSGSDAGQSLSTNSLGFCPRWRQRTFQLEYSTDCNSAENCTPFKGNTGCLPSYMYFNQIDCSGGKRRLRVLLEFSNNSYYSYYQPLKPNDMLVGEAWWDEKKNQLHVVACHFLGMTESLTDVHVGDCSVRLSLRAPAIWSINDVTSIEGQIWSNKTANDLGYFNRITFRNEEEQYGGSMLGVPGLMYQYSQQERVRGLCHTQRDVKKQVKQYPDAYSYDMRFHMSVRTSNKRIGWGNSDPLFVGDQFYSLDENAVSESDYDTSSSISVPSVNNSSRGLFNISYKISFSLNHDIDLTSVGLNSFSSMSSCSTRRVKIVAEGIYDADTGHLCMIGCRKFRADNGSSIMDCDILVKFQFPPLDDRRRGYVEGSIESTRDKTDPLYFKRLDLLSSTTYMRGAIWRMDIEVIMILICTTLQCVLVGFQLHHMKRHPKVLPNISIAMLSILTLGQMIPLVLNFGDLFSQNPCNYDGWPHMNQITVRFITIIGLLLQVRLLQQTWSARKTHVSPKRLWNAEWRAAYVTLALYAAGFFLVVLQAKWHWAIGINEVLFSSSGCWYWCVFNGLVLDGFLLPQIVLNLFSDSGENALSAPFYLGTTFISNLLPHAYDLYRSHKYNADPSADIYCTVWNIVIPLGGFLFAAIIYLQQRFGGRYILPRRIIRSEGYEKEPLITKEEAEGEKPKV